MLFSDKIEDDVARRAFTMNAIADNPYRLVDPYNGREDIKKKLIRTTRPAAEIFREDPLQMMKAVQYAAELDFDLTKEVLRRFLKITGCWKRSAWIEPRRLYGNHYGSAWRQGTGSDHGHRNPAYHFGR